MRWPENVTQLLQCEPVTDNEWIERAALHIQSTHVPDHLPELKKAVESAAASIRLLKSH